MSQTRSLVILVLFALVLLFMPPNSLLAQTESQETMALALDMFKFDQYLPALDMLEAEHENLKDNFNYWLYIGLARQRTKQLNKALEAYEIALQLNPEANNLKTRISNLKKAISTIDPSQIRNFKSNEEKALWLIEEAESLRRDKKEEKAFRTFIQAVEYDVKILGNDKDFVRRGAIYYKLKVEDNAEYSKLFYSIFKYFEGEISDAYNIIKAYKNDSSKKSLAIQRMEDYYFKRLAEANNQQKDYEIAEREERRRKQQESEKAKQEKAESKSNTNASSSDRENRDIGQLENEIREQAFASVDDSSFERRYVDELVNLKIEEYFSIQDNRKKLKIIWDLSKTGSSNENVMKVYIDALHQENIEYVSDSISAITRVGMPLAEKAFPSIMELFNYERRDFKSCAAECLGKLGIHPEIVIPKIISVYGDEDCEPLRLHYVDCVRQYGKAGLDVAYKVLDGAPRVERRPIAHFIHDLTGEKIETLMNK